MTDLITSNFSDIANILSKNAVSNTKQSSSLVATRTTFNSNGNRNNNSNSNSNSNSTKKYVNVINAKFQAIDQVNQTVDNSKGQGIIGKNKTFVSSINFDPKQDISASRSNLANSINNNNNNNNDEDDVHNTKQSHSLVPTRVNLKSNINNNSSYKNIKLIDARINRLKLCIYYVNIFFCAIAITIEIVTGTNKTGRLCRMRDVIITIVSFIIVIIIIDTFC